jgi:type I restriction enzyme S subunit
MKLSDFVDFNPQEHLAKGTQATYIAMQDLSSFSRSPNSHTLSSYNGGSKFRNGDTLMARITPCLEHGKTAFVNCLKPNELGFGSTEFIVGRAKPGISIPLFVYCLLISDHIRDIAIKSMTGTSGRERVQQAALNDITIPNYSLQDQQHIVGVTSSPQ